MKNKKAKKSQSNLNKNLENDSRFIKITSNPLFNEMSKKDCKVIVDERFKQLFTDDQFKIGNFKVDKRGRKFNIPGKDHFDNIYDIEKCEEKSFEEDEDELSDKKSEKSISNEEEEEDNISIKLDLARGEGNVSSSSSSDESEEESETEDIEEGNIAVNSWGEMDRSVRRVEWASSRIAICNLEWDRLKAEDLMIVLNSFKPPAGILHSISIFLSDFGFGRINQENINGPKLQVSNNDENAINDSIRSYQLERLRYYYAVCECDSEETAIAIYENCDGVEYETSGVRFDIRFIPTDMNFDESRLREKITFNDLNIETYKPKKFESHALLNAEAKLTWDETDPERTKAVCNAFKEDLNFHEFEQLLAPPSDSDDDEIKSRKRIDLLLESDKTTIQKNDADRTEETLQVDWVVTQDENESKEIGLNKQSVDEITKHSETKKTKLNNKNDSNNNKNEKKLTPFQEYLEKRKQRRKERKMQIQEAKKRRKEEREEFKSQHKKKGTKRCRTKDDDETLDLGDSRFTALFSDSAFAIDKTHSLYKGSKLADRQAEIKSSKRIRKEAKILNNEAGKNLNFVAINESNDDSIKESTNLIVNRIKKKMGKV